MGLQKALFVMMLMAAGTFAEVTNYYVTPTGTGDRTQGLSWATSVSIDTFGVMLSSATNIINDSDQVWVLAGDYTLGATIDARANDNISTGYVTIKAVKAGTTNEPPLPSDFVVDMDPTFNPLGLVKIDNNGYAISFGSCVNVRGFSFTSFATSLLTFDQYSKLENCVIRYTGTSVTTNAVNFGGNGFLINCRITGGSNCNGGNAGGSNFFVNCNFDSLKTAINIKGVCVTIVGCNFLKNTIVAVTIGTLHEVFINNCSFFGNAQIITGSEGSHNVVARNLAVDSTTGSAFSWSTYMSGNRFENICISPTRNFYPPFVNIDTVGTNAVIDLIKEDPLFINPIDGNFALQHTSPCIGTGK